jgi:hypothetical protein
VSASDAIRTQRPSTFRSSSMVTRWLSTSLVHVVRTFAIVTRRPFAFSPLETCGASGVERQV